MNKIILASASPRRRELLEQIGISFTVQVSSVEEVITKTKAPDIVMDLSRQKAAAVMEEIKAKKQAEDILVIGADTVVEAFTPEDGKILGKPQNEEDAFYMLNLLQGNTHKVYTGVTLCKGDKVHSFYEETKVFVYEMEETEILEYIKTGEPADKAGGYGIQGRFAAFIKGIEGDYNNVVGLPTGRLYQEMKHII